MGDKLPAFRLDSRRSRFFLKQTGRIIGANAAARRFFPDSGRRRARPTKERRAV